MPRTLSRVLTNYLSMTDTQGPDTHRLVHKPSQAVQKGRSKRRGEAYPLRYVEPLSAARTPLADFVNSLLEELPALLAVTVENGPRGAILVPCSIDGCRTRAHARETSYVNICYALSWAKRERHEQARGGGPNGTFYRGNRPTGLPD